jgi:hypothetical protein
MYSSAFRSDCNHPYVCVLIVEIIIYIYIYIYIQRERERGREGGGERERQTDTSKVQTCNWSSRHLSVSTATLRRG